MPRTPVLPIVSMQERPCAHQIFTLLMVISLSACTPGYAPSRGPAERDLTGVLVNPDRSEIRISYEPKFMRGAVTTATLGFMTMEYILDEHLVGSHTIYEAYDQVVPLEPGDHEIVLQRCYRGLLTLGGRDCNYVKYAFALSPHDSATMRVIEPYVFKPENHGFLRWYELESTAR